MRVPCRGPLVFLLGVAGYLGLTAVAGLAQGAPARLGTRPLIDDATAVNIGPTGGDIARLAVSPANLNLVFAAPATGGLHASSDGGGTWGFIGAGLPDINVRGIAPHPTQPLTALVGTLSGGIAQTTDGGLKWITRNNGLLDFGGFYTSVNAFAYDPVTPSTVYSATDRGVYKTLTDGNQWASSGLSVRALTDIDVAMSNGSVIYTMDSFVVFKSTDKGVNWTGVTTGLPGNGLTSLTVDPTNPNIVFVSAASLYRTFNGGAQWTALSGACLGLAPTDLVIDPADHNHLAVSCDSGANPVRTSTDGGSTWTTGGLFNGFPRDLVIAGGQLLAGTSTGVFRSSDFGTSFTVANTNLMATRVNRVRANGTGIVYSSGTTGQEIHSVDPVNSANTFFDSHNPDLGFASVLYAGLNISAPGPGSVIFGNAATVYLSASGARTSDWQPMSTGLPSGFEMQAINGDAANPNMVMLSGGYSNLSNPGPNVFTADLASSDKTWKPLAKPVPGLLAFDGFHSVLDPRVYIVGSYAEGLQKSDDEGKSWFKMTGFPAGVPAYQLLVDGAQEQIILVNVGYTILRSADGGKTFTGVTAPAEFGGLSALIKDPVNGTLFAGSTNGCVFKSTDGGATWTLGATLYAGMAVNSLSITTDGRLVVGTSNGLWVTAVLQTTPPPVPPTITVHPGNAAGAAGDAISFSCAATGTLPISFKWEIGTNGTDYSAVPGTDIITSAGETSTLTVPNLLTDNSYQRFHCTATNVAGSATSNDGIAYAKGSLLNQERVSGRIKQPSSLRTALQAVGATVTPPQMVTVRAGGTGHPWTATADKPWILIAGGSGNGTGQFSIGFDPAAAPASGTVTGTVTVTESSFPVTQTIAVELSVLSTTTPPIGGFDTPVDGATGLSGSVAVTGWTVDDVGVKRVELWRTCVETIDRPGGRCVAVNNTGPANFVSVGEANFVAGARPDIEAANPTLPQANRAGWGYLLLTNFLPHIPLVRGQGGQGTFVLYAYAVDQEDQYTLLGSKTIGLDNDNATTPFGGIDTPTQGGTVTTNVYVNFGWAMAPGTRCIDTTSIAGYAVFIDGVPRTLRPTATSTATQNWVPGLNRADLVALFPGLCNTDNALAAYYIDAAELGLTTGVHTISWLVTDTAGNPAGIGSRFFTVAIGSSQTTSATIIAGTPAAQTLAVPQRLASGRVSASIGFGNDHFTALKPGDEGRLVVEVPMDGRVVLDLDGAVDRGNQELLGMLRPLPVGSTLDAATGRFSWQPPIGFLGPFKLVFTIRDARIDVTVNVVDPGKR